MAHSTKPVSGEKRAAKFPLTLHRPTGQYRKRIRGKDFSIVNGPVLGFARMVVGRTDDLACFHAAPCEQRGCNLWPVIATAVLVDPRTPPKFTPDHALVKIWATMTQTLFQLPTLR